MSTSKIVAIDTGKRWETTALEDRRDQSTGSASAPLQVNLAAVSERVQPYLSATELKPRDLYPDAELDSVVANALRFADRAKSALEAARETNPIDNFFSFDEQIITAHALIAKAFRYRNIGDGFAAIINALNWALANRTPGSPNNRQLSVMLETLDRLIEGPFIHFDTAMTIMDELENAELEIDPPVLDLLTSSLDD
jgi:hypothetical protein